VDIAPTPDAVVVPPGLTEALGRLSRWLDGAIALISGRPISQLDRWLAPLALPAAGVHGAERRRADGRGRAAGTARARRRGARGPSPGHGPSGAAGRAQDLRGGAPLPGAPQCEALCRAAMQDVAARSPRST
jgi:trehalose 6-phosphate phosphatase